MDLQQRLNLLAELGQYILSNPQSWRAVKDKAFYQNGWFIPEFVDHATINIALDYLDKEALLVLSSQYKIPTTNTAPKNVGIVMAGNIPMVGFHDFLSTFISGHYQTIKLSSRDDVLLKHLVEQMIKWAPELSEQIRFSEMLKGCDAYIATGSNNSARYFEYYFSRFPHIIRKNRTSVAILDGTETIEELDLLADDVYMFFGLGCRNVTKIYVPADYDFLPLLNSFRKYNHLFDHHKYKGNYDYQLAIFLINKHYYMTNGSIILHQEPSVFSPISVLNYEFYTEKDDISDQLLNNNAVQAIVGKGYLPFGAAQRPRLTDFADRVDTLQFLLSI
jgi:hypothetical protein